MKTSRSGLGVSGALFAGFVTVVSLLLPWFDLLGRERSSIDMLRSASSLDVIEGVSRVLVIAGWLVMPVLLAIAFVVAAAGYHRLAASLVLPVGLVTLLVVLVGLLVDDISLAWGAVVAAVFATAAAGLAMMVLFMPQSWRTSGAHR